MIGKLTGIVDHKGQSMVLLDVNGVGYEIHCSDRTLAELPGVGERVALFTELLVREDLMQLFGFRTAEGVARAIALGDAAAVKAAPGVGPKLATRLVNELKDKAPGVMAMGGDVIEAMGDAPAMAAPVAAPAASSSAQAEALSALRNLGYAPADAAQAVARAAGEDAGAETPSLIRAALRLLAPKD